MINPKFEIRNLISLPLTFILSRKGRGIRYTPSPFMGEGWGEGDQRGVALLPMILVLFGLVAVVGIAIAGISVSESSISSTKDASDEALVIAESGIQDALMKLSRNKDFTSAGYPLPASLFASGGTATIVVPGPAGVFPKNITSSGTLNSKTRKIQLTVDIDVDGNGKITQSGWLEVAP